MRSLTISELAQVIALHKKWLQNKEGGVRADLTDANMTRADLTDANMSQAKSVTLVADWLAQNFKRDKVGVIVFRRENGDRAHPSNWEFKVGAIIEEVVNPDRCTICGCGVSFATLEWVRGHYKGPIWRCRIKWIDLADVVVPFGTDGKARCRRLELLEVIDG